MTQEHPITPPPELIRKWNEEAANAPMADQRYIATQAARWGADEELEACCEWVSWRHSRHESDELLFARRPKPPSLKEQALALISHDPENQPFLSEKGIAIIRRALESLPD